jgi:signal transduction histidine kinase
MLTIGVVLLLTFTSYFIYEIVTFRQNAIRQLAINAKIISSNSTAALAFEDQKSADEILGALKAEPHVDLAVIYDKNGKPFSYYPQHASPGKLPSDSLIEGYRFEDGHLIACEPIIQGSTRLGTLYIASNLEAMFDRLKLYATIAALVALVAFPVAYFYSNWLQQSISGPVLTLASVAKTVSEKKDYSVRADKTSKDEIGALTDAFNMMLAEIQMQNEEIHQFNQKLEQTVEKRTQDLEAAVKELEAFSYSVSHDLRAPLRSINGYSRILMEDYSSKLDDEGIQTLETILRNALRMGQLIDDLLDFSRIGKQNVLKVKLDMTVIVNAVLQELKEQYPRDAEVIISPMPLVYGDSSMLKQVMQNLLSNALKYSMKKEHARIEIGGYSEANFNVYYVRDNGAGFDMDYYDKLFGVFQRLHSAREFEGTGVGLALVHRIITKHDGKIWAKGKVNEGATFYFSLPATKQP